jgi:cytochrome c-type biogenesis protein CcmH
MITFWAVAILLLAIAVAMLLWPLLKASKANQSDIDQRQMNINIAKERLAELDKEREDKELSDEDYQEIKKELEGALFFDLEDQSVPQDEEKEEKAGTWGFVLIAIFVPLLSISMYVMLGSPEGMKMIPGQQPERIAANPQQNQAGSIKEMVIKLVEKLKKNPKDADSWFVMGRTMMNLDQYQEAVIAFRKVLSLTGDDAVTLVSLADALAMEYGGVLDGEPESLLEKAITLDGNNVTALWLLGMAAERRENHQLSLSYWEKLYPMLENGDPTKDTLKDLITEAKSGLENGGSVTANIAPAQSINSAKTTNSTQIRVSVRISDELRASTSGNELVFIYAKAMSGPPMPLAAVKMKVSDLPADVILNDSMAMMPQMKLSSFDKVIIGARVSKSGQPVSQMGDYEGEIANISVKNQKEVVTVIINKIKK